MGFLTSKIIAALLVLAVLVGGYILAVIAGLYYPCSLPALTAHQARQQVGHFMRTAGTNQKALDLISGLQRMGAGAEIIDRLSDNCRDCLLSTESIGPLQSIWEVFLSFPSKEGIVDGRRDVVLQIGSCQAVLIERSWFEPPIR